MSEDFSKRCFLVADKQGLFIGVANRLVESGARVLYWNPEDKRMVVNDAIVGAGLKGVTKVLDFWSKKNEVDVFVFPDVGLSGEQQELRSQGFPVWGAGKAMELEQDRIFFLEKLKELGLDVPPYTVVKGLANLEAFLKDKEDIWIKMSLWRGSWETCHWRSWKQDAHRIDFWRFKFSGLKDNMVFICFPKIETDLEIGVDTYYVGGKWPSTMLHGIESKDEAYFSAVTPRKEMPEQLLPIMEAFTPFLKEAGAASQVSMEVRVTEKESFFIDWTARGGLPSTNSFLAAKNVPEIIFYGAHGELVEPDYGFKFSAECMVKIHGEQGSWETIELPPEVKENLMLADYCEVKGQVWFPADEEGSISEIGWLRATGDTPTEVAERINALADELPDGADASVEALADVIREIESEGKQGIKFTEQPLPDPEIVLAES